MLRQDTRVNYRVLVIDYGCPDGTFDWVKSCYDPRLHCIQIKDNTAHFNLNRCRNLGVEYADSHLVTLVDADIAPPANFVSKALQFIGVHHADFLLHAINGDEPFHTFDGAYTHNPLPQQLEGIIQASPGTPWVMNCPFIRRNAWKAVNGYDEAFLNWGYDDVDFYKRVMDFGIKVVMIGQSFTWLHHGDEESTKFLAEPNKLVSKEANRKLMMSQRPVNKSGYAITKDPNIWTV